ncbi:hypothetical protein [Pseudemcibacter aquimaris]|uniref:hypothetical protein n=1 Tax=Pseudemcibacter aquimaris TaxID=2857064 RepID=UPI002011B359|nr:hypothetical protein [Pseudemcibacter aquimaris]MCC3862585.1 hypothetical protein [Pseudemcibacter aquimaris]WDU57897.1 hypothetical protein KW060_11910 [Pseudemcibacter aquimaris]
MDTFIFKSATYDETSQTIALGYAYLDGPEFSEKIHFPGAKASLNDEERHALDLAMRQLHLAAGISYYKAYCPRDIRVENHRMTKEEADFFFKFYRHGLGEFSVENNIDLSGVIRFPVTSNHHLGASDIELPSSSVVPIGGGKDSVVSLEVIKAAGKPHHMIAINAGRPILEVMDAAGGDAIHIKRTLDPALFELNEKGAMNGHVPITGILSFVMACGAILYGYDSVVMSNEGSASEGNMEFAGIEVNHQYSKSLEFELDFEEYIRLTALKNFKYFSLLRPLNETGIAALFSGLTHYFDTFKSCNRNFHIDEGERKYGWCCDCPKCRFVFLALSPFIKRDRLIDIFGKNMLVDMTQEDGFRELCGLKGHKPFECVGEIEECQIIMRTLTTTEWADDGLVKMLAGELENPTMNVSALKASALTFKYDHNIPDEFLESLNEFIGS